MLSLYMTPFIAMIVMLVLSCAALHFAQYKRRGMCCSDRIQTSEKAYHGCKTCKCKESQT
ncbi:MAG: hypothetical protein GY809_02760 [Planctomycetes bacterium]|nr:hypothetical protein [Planctomycetota bacterium]